MEPETVPEAVVAAVPEIKERSWSPYQQALFDISRERHVIVDAVAGCLAGDTIIGINRGGKSTQISISDLVLMFNGGSRSNRRWDPLICTMVRYRDDDGYVRLGTLDSAYLSGHKRVFELTVETGEKIKATADHQFLSENGWVTLGDLRIGTHVYIDGGVSKSNIKSPKRLYKTITSGMESHPYAAKRGVRDSWNPKGHVGVPVHRLTMEASLNGLSYGEFLQTVRKHEIDGLIFIDPAIHTVHHVDENPLNNHLGNLVLMLTTEHNRQHAQENWWMHVTARTKLSRVVSIIETPSADTYDLGMANEPHNFLANGFVVHNSGKTTTICEKSKRMSLGDALFCAFNRHSVADLKPRLGASVACSTLHGVGHRTVSAALGRLREPNPKKYKDETNKLAFSLAVTVHGDMPSNAQRRDTNNALEQMLHFCRVNTTDPLNIYDFIQCADRFGVDMVDSKSATAFADCVLQLMEWGKDVAIRHQVVDFDDMIWLPYALKLRPDTFDTVFVDECQDLSAAQRRLALSTVAPNGQLIAVGDPRQAIYAFAGADCDSFHEIRRTADAVQLPLSICYRCPPEVVALAKTYVPQIESAPNAKPGIVEYIDHDKIFEMGRPGDLFLSRTNARAISDCLAFLGRRIQARMRGRDVGKKLIQFADQVADLGGRKRWNEFGNFINQHVVMQAAKAREADKEGSAVATEDMGAALLTCYMNFMARDYESLKLQIGDLFADTGNVIWFSTIHRAKGLENPRVFILDYTKLPLRWKNQKSFEADQERNLLYVAITRAQSELYLVDEKI